MGIFSFLILRYLPILDTGDTTSMTMKSFMAIAFLALAAFASAEDEVEITETREICGAAGWRHGACKREILKREDCHRAGGMTHCNGKREDEEFERVETRELCKKTVSGIICGREVLKRELCRPTATAGDRCKRLVVEGEDEEKEDVKRELCVKKGFCGRMVAEECRPTPTAGSRCKRMEGEFEEDLEKRNPSCKEYPSFGAGGSEACRKAYGPTWI